MPNTQDRVVETTLRVRYAETDAMGVVYHANYLIWFEAGRGDYFRAFGQDYGAWEQAGYFLPVVELHARYLAPARYGDTVTVRTWMKQARSRSITLGYEAVLAETDHLLATGWTQHLCTDAGGNTRRLPDEMRRLAASD
jgi:acyl-CoA thioester hydrolase